MVQQALIYVIYPFKDNFQILSKICVHLYLLLNLWIALSNDGNIQEVCICW